MADFTINRLISGGLITNYFCSSKCRHCLYNAGPHRDKKYIDPETAEANLRMVRWNINSGLARAISSRCCSATGCIWAAGPWIRFDHFLKQNPYEKF